MDCIQINKYAYPVLSKEVNYPVPVRVHVVDTGHTTCVQYGTCTVHVCEASCTDCTVHVLPVCMCPHVHDMH